MWYGSRCLVFLRQMFFSRELIALLCCCRDLGCMATRMVEQDNSNVQGCHQWHACIQSTPQSLDLHLKHISAVTTFYRKFPVEHRASCRNFALSCRRSASSCRKTVCSCKKLYLPVEDPNHEKNCTYLEKHCYSWRRC